MITVSILLLVLADWLKRAQRNQERERRQRIREAWEQWQAKLN